jgi:ketosteroid isomerase-like protein
VVAALSPSPEYDRAVSTSTKPPGRAVLRLAGVLTQLICASCLLLGTIAFVLVQQNNSGGSGYVIVWAAAALAGLVFGGLIGRGGMISVIGCAVLDAGFGIVLLALDHAVLRGLVRVLPASDVDMIASILVGAGVVMLAIAAVCLAAIPQALRYARWLRNEVEREEHTEQVTILPPGQPRPVPMQYTLTQHSGLHVRPSPDHVLEAASSTNKGWTPHTAKISVWHVPAATPEERRSRRRLYLALAGFAIGFGAGIGVLVSSAQKRDREDKQPVATAPQPDAGARTQPTAPTPDAADGPIGEGGSAEDVKRPPSVQMLVQAQRVAIANADLDALVATLAPSAAGFGVDADEVGEGKSALAAFLDRDLGLAGAPASGFTVEASYTTFGEVDNHAWIALELEVRAPDRPTRRFAITELAYAKDGQWTVLAWHWSIPVADSTAERLAILGTLPSPKPITELAAAPKDIVAAVRAAFASREAFVDARSERDDAFNFGSAPNERIKGGARIKKVFSNLRAEIRLHDGLRIVSGDAWDPAQKGAPTIAYALANVDFTTKTRAATDLTQTFRVLAVLVKEGSTWNIVQTQWSHGGPIR